MNDYDALMRLNETLNGNFYLGVAWGLIMATYIWMFFDYRSSKHGKHKDKEESQAT